MSQDFRTGGETNLDSGKIETKDAKLKSKDCPRASKVSETVFSAANDALLGSVKAPRYDGRVLTTFLQGPMTGNSSDETAPPLTCDTRSATGLADPVANRFLGYGCHGTMAHETRRNCCQGLGLQARVLSGNDTAAGAMIP